MAGPLSRRITSEISEFFLEQGVCNLLYMRTIIVDCRIVYPEIRTEIKSREREI